MLKCAVIELSLHSALGTLVGGGPSPLGQTIQPEAAVLI